MKKKSFCGRLLIVVCVVFGLGAGCLLPVNLDKGLYWVYCPAQLKELSGMTEIQGNLLIGSTFNAIYRDISSVYLGTPWAGVPLRKLKNLDGLESLTTISGSLVIGGVGYIDTPMFNPKLTDIEGLRNLTSIGGNLDIRANGSLTNLDGLRNLKTIGGRLRIIGNKSLINLDGLSSLVSVGKGIEISDLPSLTDIDGLNSLTTIGETGSGSLFITGNRSLVSVSGLNNLTYIETSLIIRENKSLENISGLSKLTDISGTLKIYDNPLLTDFDGLYQMTFLGGDLGVFCNDHLPETAVLELKDLLVENEWNGCWDFTCDDTDNPVCPAVE